MYQVLKRNGKVIDFELDKISAAIKMAFEAQEKQYHPSIIDFLALKVTAEFEPKIKEGLIAVEDIQDSVESVLVQAGYADVAKAYILYRRQREKLRNMKNTVLDYKGIALSYGYSVDYFAYLGIDKTGSQRGCTMITVTPGASTYITHENYYQDKYQPLYEKEVVDMTK